ncbi:MAG: ComEC/Rec2 family competence protein [Alphaproteobacteria bacterium]|nr:ComEC/Rec2 family competence protein [Alphaproteobacteria bacterium]
MWRWRPLAYLAAALAAEGDRGILWLPVFFATGIALYFTPTIEPPWWLGLAATSVAIVAALLFRRRPALRNAALALAFGAAGLAVIQQARWERGTAMLDRRIGPVALIGRVIDIDLLDRGWRVLVSPDPLPGLTAAEQPRRVRLHIAPSSDELRPGDRLQVKAMLFPVPGQIMPGARDMQRELYFAGIGGVGYSYGGARRIAEPGDAHGEGGWREWLLQLRSNMTQRIATALPGAAGGVASAVITGKRGTMPEEIKQAFRDSGLSHLLAIAGLHLGLVGGFVFFAVRGGLALIPWIALRYPIKKITALVTLVVLFCYLMISGAAIPTQRAFVMTGIVFVAVLIDRLRISMRICALAAMVVLVLDPASLVGLSFQMSFGAVVALIAVYETWGARLAQLFHRGSFARKALGYCGAVAVTTVVATIGTEPFAIYHFHHLVLYSPLANVIAVPISAMWTLPWGVVACLLMPFGLEWLALTPMGWGIDVTIAVAQWVAALPGNIWSMPRLPVVGVVLVALGGCWLCLWQQKWRYWGIAGIAAGMMTMLLTRPPDLILADFGHFLAARTLDGNYRVAQGGEKLHRSFLVSETGAELLPWPDRGDPAGDGLDCGVDSRCTYATRGRRVAIVTAEAGLPVLCSTVDAIVAQVPAGFACRGKVPVVDRIDTWRHGAVALWLDTDGVTVGSANESRGDRPWVPHPKSRREREKEAAANPAPSPPPADEPREAPADSRFNQPD